MQGIRGFPHVAGVRKNPRFLWCAVFEQEIEVINGHLLILSFR